MEPKRGMLAVCSRGELGLITSHGLMPVSYSPEPECICASGGDYHHMMECPVYAWRNDSTLHGLAWTGVHLIGEKAGQPWSSRNPRPVATIQATDSKETFMVKPVNGYGAAMFYPEGSR